MIKNAKSILATTSSNTSTITLPFGKTDEIDEIKPIATISDKCKHEEAITTLTFGKTDEKDITKPVTAKTDKCKIETAIPDKIKSGRTVPNFGKKISQKQPDRKLPTTANNVPEVNTVDEFDLGIYDTVDVSDDLCHRLLEGAVCLEHSNDERKRDKFYIIKTKTAFALKNKGNSFTWICSGFNILQKVKSPNGEVRVDIQTTDALGSTNSRVPVEYFTRANLKELAKYGVMVNPGYELIVSMYLTKVINGMDMESAQQKLGFSLSKGKMKFSAYADGTFTTSNTFGTEEAYIAALNELIRDSVPIQYLLSASMSAAVMTVLNLDYHMKLNSYIINVVGKSSTGKTIANRLCASAWSDPNSDKVFKPMHSTSNALYKRLDGRFGVPMFLDEGKVGNNINADEFIISIASEREKDRLNPDSSEKYTCTWNTVIVMTSEEHFHDNGKSQNGGPVVRIHNAENLSYTNSREHADEIEDFISHNYGVLGRIFTDWLIKYKDKLKTNYEKMKEIIRKITSTSHNDYTERLIKSYGLTFLTAKILCKLGLDINCVGVAEIMQEQNEAISAEYNMAENALNAIKDYVIKNLYSDEMIVYSSSKNDNEVTSVVIPEGLTKSILDKAGFATKVAVREIDKAGYLRRQGNGKRNGLKPDFRINHVRRTCYQFRFCDESKCKGEKLIESPQYPFGI